jgi:transcriptional regulator with XRE-family HTH domain
MVNVRQLDPTTSPLHAFGVQLRRFREAKNLTQAQLGKLMRYSASLISYVEQAKKRPLLLFAQRADIALETGGTLELMWWQLYHSAFIEGFPQYAAHEAEAVAIRLFQIGLIPGLLQTKEYATAWEAGNVRRGRATQEEADERVAFLLARQQLFERVPAPTVRAVLDEGCLRRPIGGPAVMAGQLRRLEQLAQRPNVIIQVAPYSLGADRPFTHPVTLLTLPDRTVIAYTETEQRGYLERDADAVAVLTADYDDLQVEALPQAASLAMIREARKELEHHD